MSSSIQGGQVVARACAISRVVGSSAPDGISSAEVADRAGTTRPTAHRMLMAFAEAGFVDRDASRGLWHVGPELYLMGSLAASRYDITEHAKESVQLLLERRVKLRSCPMQPESRPGHSA